MGDDSAAHIEKAQERGIKGVRFQTVDQLEHQIEEAVEAVLNKGLRTADIYETGTQKVSCTEMGAAIVKELKG